MRILRVSIRKVLHPEEEQVVLECVEMTRDFEDIREYALMKGNLVAGYINDAVYQIPLMDVLYFEAVGERVFARMKNGEDILISRMYAKELKKGLMEG